MFNATKIHCQLCHLLPNRCGKRFISFAHSAVVSFIISQKWPITRHFRQINKMSPAFRAAKRLPFVWNTPIGYLIAVFITYIIVGYAYFIVACTITLGIGAYCFVISATTEVQHILHSIHRKAHLNGSQSSKLNVLLPKYIHAHRIVIQLSINLIF